MIEEDLPEKIMALNYLPYSHEFEVGENRVLVLARYKDLNKPLWLGARLDPETGRKFFCLWVNPNHLITRSHQQHTVVEFGYEHAWSLLWEQYRLGGYCGCNKCQE